MAPLASDIVGRPWSEAQAMLQAAGMPCETCVTRPARDYFRTDERELYVVRANPCADGVLQVVLAARLARLRKEVP